MLGLVLPAHAAEVGPSERATFPGRVSRLSPDGGLMRVRVDFKNAKFLNRGDRLEFWDQARPSNRCITRVEGRSPDYLLLKVPEYNACVTKVHLTVGAYLLFWGQDLENNLNTATELVDVLIRKRMALLSRHQRYKLDLTNHEDRVEALNSRYEVLRQKLETEHNRELGNLEEDKARQFVAMKDTETKLHEVESKLESYRVHDHNFTVDRWSLDPDLYTKK